MSVCLELEYFQSDVWMRGTVYNNKYICKKIYIL